MKLQLASDLHLEFAQRERPGTRLVEPAPGAELLVLAGDIHNGTLGIEAFADWPVPVLYVAGNHEFYDQQWEPTREQLRAACAGTAVRLLDHDVVEFDGVRVLGCTLWTDFRLTDEPVAQAMAAVERGLTDYRVIATASGPLRAAQTLADHQASRQWLTGELARPFAGRTVVVTHHAPHPRSIHPRFAGHPMNPGFISDLTPLLASADLWLHGHTHDSFDYRVGGCRVVANPAGYLLRKRCDATASAQPELENARFDAQLLLDVAH